MRVRSLINVLFDPDTQQRVGRSNNRRESSFWNGVDAVPSHRLKPVMSSLQDTAASCNAADRLKAE